MTAPSRKSYVTTAIWAVLIAGLSVIGCFAAIGFPTPGRRLAGLACVPAIPGQLVAAFLGIGHGPDGFPTQEDVAPYIFTFFLWWGLLHFARTWWRRRRTASR